MGRATESALTILAIALMSSPLAAEPGPALAPEKAEEVESTPPPLADEYPQEEPAQHPEKEEAKKGGEAHKLIEMFEFGTLWYLHYRYGFRAKDSSDPSLGHEYFNRFDIGRGYLTMKVKPVKWFQARITLDAHQDEAGDMKVRLKYLYGKFTAPVETKVVSEPSLEFGLVHMPWLDYEEHVNWYRCQGTMFMERNKLFNSADFGATFGLLLGKKLPKDYQEKVSKKYPGTWGSLAIGVYNAGGYHALEKNKGKSFEGRISIRPLGHIFPNIQLSYFVIVGRGNVEETEDYDPPSWLTHAWMASIEHQYLVVTGQFVMGHGNQKGSFADWIEDPVSGEPTGFDDVQDYLGASGYLEIKVPQIMSSLIGRLDWFRKEKDGEWFSTKRIIAGYAFHFLGFHKNFLLVDLDYVMPDDAIANAQDIWEVKLTLQVKL